METNQTKQFESSKTQTSFKREKQKDGSNGGQAETTT